MYLSLVSNQGGGIHAEEEFNPCIRVCCLFFMTNDIKICPSFYSQDFLSFHSLSRDWILKLDPNDNFRNYPKFRYS